MKNNYYKKTKKSLNKARETKIFLKKKNIKKRQYARERYRNLSEEEHEKTH